MEDIATAVASTLDVEVQFATIVQVLRLVSAIVVHVAPAERVIVFSLSAKSTPSVSTSQAALTALEVPSNESSNNLGFLTFTSSSSPSFPSPSFPSPSTNLPPSNTTQATPPSPLTTFLPTP